MKSLVVKRSIVITGRKTSVSLEDAFWNGLKEIAGVLKAEWPSTLALAQMGDAMDFEALVPVGRWKGFGGVTNFNGAGFESFTWAAGIGASTRRAGIFATSHVPTMHPVMAAKQ